MIGNCILCGFKGLEGDHRCLIPSKPNGYEFWMNGKQYLTDYPSLSVPKIRKRVGFGETYQMYQETEKGDIPLSDMNAVDCRAKPRLYIIPPATY